jgi:hypothetical protein
MKSWWKFLMSLITPELPVVSSEEEPDVRRRQPTLVKTVVETHSSLRERYEYYETLNDEPEQPKASYALVGDQSLKILITIALKYNGETTIQVMDWSIAFDIISLVKQHYLGNDIVEDTPVWYLTEKAWALVEEFLRGIPEEQREKYKAVYDALYRFRQGTKPRDILLITQE